MHHLLAFVVLLLLMLFVVNAQQRTTESYMEEFLQMGLVNDTSIGCANVAPETDHFVPGFNMPELPMAQIEHIMDQLSIQTPYKCMAIYGTTNGKHNLIPAAKARGLKVMLTVWLELNSTQNDENIRMAIYAAKNYPETVVALSCGSEFILRTGDAAFPIMRDCAARLRAAQITQPIGFREITSSLFASGKNVADAFDWIGVNIFLYWDLVWSGVDKPALCDDPATLQVQSFEGTINQARQMFPNKPIIVSEWGWPSGGKPSKEVYPACIAAVVNEDWQRKVLIAGMQKLKEMQVSSFMFQSFSNGVWKIPQEGSVGMYWGTCSATWPNDCYLCNPSRFDGCKWPYIGIPQGYPPPPLTISQDGKSLMEQSIPQSEDWGQPYMGPPQPFYVATGGGGGGGGGSGQPSGSAAPYPQPSYSVIDPTNGSSTIASSSFVSMTSQILLASVVVGAIYIASNTMSTPSSETINGRNHTPNK